MKRFFHSLLAVVLGLSCAQAKDYVIEASLPDEEGKEFIVFDYDKQTVINRGKVENGKLRIVGTSEEPILARVESGPVFANCVLDSLAVLDFNTHYTAGGSRLNRILCKLKLREDSIYGVFRQLAEQNRAGELSDSLYKVKGHALMLESLGNQLKDIKEHDNGVGYCQLLGILNYPDFDYGKWKELYPEIPPYLKSTDFANRLNDMYGRQEITAEGKAYVDLSGKDMNGNPVKLSDYVGKGKYVLVDFWASWCGPCRQEAKETLMPLYDRMKDKENFEILGVATWDDETNTRKALETLGYGWTQMLDAGEAPMRLYGFNGIPMIILFGPDGTILKRGLRGEQLVEAVEEYVGK